MKVPWMNTRYVLSSSSETGNTVKRWYLYDTPIVELEYGFNCVYVSLNTGRFNTVTTKRRMNQILDFEGRIPARVYQKKFDWFVSFNGEDIPFHKNTRAEFTLRIKHNESITKYARMK